MAGELFEMAVVAGGAHVGLLRKFGYAGVALQVLVEVSEALGDAVLWGGAVEVVEQDGAVGVL